MELKLNNNTFVIKANLCLNRTFYGIETFIDSMHNVRVSVLIVPFMELKRF